MIVGTIIPGSPASVAFDLSTVQFAACAHALRAGRDVRFRLAEMTADDVVALRELTGAIDAFDAQEASGAHDTVQLTAARLLLVSDAVSAFVAAQAVAEVSTEDDRRHLRVAAELSEPLAELAARALAAALGDLPDVEVDDDAFDALLDGE